MGVIGEKTDRTIKEEEEEYEGQPAGAGYCNNYATTLRFIRKKNCTLYMIAKYINCTF